MITLYLSAHLDIDETFNHTKATLRAAYMDVVHARISVLLASILSVIGDKHVTISTPQSRDGIQAVDNKQLRIRASLSLVLALRLDESSG